jgi:hypothetical protein
MLSSPIDGSGLLAAADMGISTWRVGIAAAVGISTWVGAATLWITSIEDIAASTYDFHATHGMFT